MTDTPTDDTLAMYADYVCPFCYLGEASLDQYLESTDDPPEIEWRPFDLRGYKRGPDGGISHDVDDGKDDDYFAQVRENVERLKERYGVEMDLDYSLDVDSWNAQKAALFVRENHPERFEAFHEAVFEALWQDGRDIGDPEVLAEIAEGVGLPGEEIHDAATSEDLDADLEKRFGAAHDSGVTAVPTFAYGDHAARGAVPPEQLKRLVEGY